MRFLIGVDLGTSGLKTVLFSEDGRIISSASMEYPLSQPHNGWAEQDPADWWNAAVHTLREVLDKSGVRPEDIVGLGISGQMHGLTMLGASGDVLRPCIIWADQRTGAECEEITRRVGAERLIEITANPALTGFTASKILWVRNHEPDVYAKCRHLLLPKDYLRYKLTGEFATEVSDASGMQLLDVPRRKWSEEVLAALEIDGGMLGRVYESPEVTGVISKEAAALTGLSTRTVVVGGAGDNAAAAVGMGVVEDGRAFTSIGTSGVVFVHSDALSIDSKGRVHTFCCAVPGAWHVMGVVQAAGLSLRWLRDEFCQAEVQAAAAMGVDPYELIGQAVAKAPIGANRLIYLPYLMGERTPHLDPNCRGAFVGLSAIHTRRDIMRAVMEGATYALRDSLGILHGMNVLPSEMLACGGGARSPLWRQMVSDMFALPVRTALSSEGPALGVAILAGVGASVYPDVRTACRQLIRYGHGMEPDAMAAAYYTQGYAVYRGLYPALAETFRNMKAL